MILEIDIGNTFTKWRHSGGERGKLFTANFTSAGFSEWQGLDVTEVKVASVGGEEVNGRIRACCAQLGFPEPRFAATTDSAAGVVNSYGDPSRMGVDRWLAMLAAYGYESGACCVVDCGSAITVDYLAANGEHIGGYIIPGLNLMQRGLLANTAEILVDQEIDDFDLSPGRHTSAAVTHGINFAFAALVEKIVAELNGASLYITGGDGALFHRLAGTGSYKPDLVLDGLAWGLGS